MRASSSRSGRRAPSVGTHLVVGFGLCVAMVGALLVMSTRATFHRERERANERLESAAVTSARDYSYMDDTIEQVSSFAASPGIAALNPASCEETLGALGDSIQGARADVVGPEGTMVCSNPHVDAGSPVPDGQKWLEAASGSTEVVALPEGVDTVTGKAAATWLFPVVAPDGRVGVFALVSYMNEPPPALPKDAIHGTFVMLLAPDHRFVLAATPAAPYAPARTVPADARIARSLSKTGMVVHDPDGVERLYVETAVENSEWILLAGVPLDAALADARHELVRNAVLGAATLALVLLLGFMLHRRLARPVRRLGETIAASRDGDRDARAVVDGPREIAVVAAAYNDLADEQRALEDHLRHDARHDRLTGLPNRAHLEELLTEHLADAGSTPVAVLFLDLDRFKLINDSHGHATGDTLLVALSERLHQSLEGEWLLSRFGGDEFVIVCPRSTVEMAVAIAERIVRVVRSSLHIDGHELYVGGSVGIAMATPGDTAADVIRNADTAMYRAKDDGRGGWVVFDEAMRARSVARLALEQDLHDALDRGEIELHFQPKFTVDGSELVGMEALARWNHPERGMVPPNEFIPIAEDTGLILPMGEWVLEGAARQSLAWRLEFGRPVPVAVNVAARQLGSSSLAGVIAGVLRRTGALPSDLVVEVTESAILTDVEMAVRELDAVRAMGIAVSIDDFGTGYSSLSYLKRLPADELKIDRSFIADLTSDRTTEAIVGSVIDLSHAIGLRVVAEGIEEPAQLDTLRLLGCDVAQGYHLGRPVPLAEATAVVAGAAASGASAASVPTSR